MSRGGDPVITLRAYPAELAPRERFLRLANEAKSIAYWGAETDDPMPEDDMFLRAAMGLGLLARLQSGCDTAALMVCLLAGAFTKSHDGPQDGPRARIVGQVLDDPAAAMAKATADALAITPADDECWADYAQRMRAANERAIDALRAGSAQSLADAEVMLSDALCGEGPAFEDERESIERWISSLQARRLKLLSDGPCGIRFDESDTQTPALTWTKREPVGRDPFYTASVEGRRLEIRVVCECFWEWSIDDPEEGELARGTVAVDVDMEEWDYQGADVAQRRCEAVARVLIGDQS